jgi:hypothetical protein
MKQALICAADRPAIVKIVLLSITFCELKGAFSRKIYGEKKYWKLRITEAQA